MNSPIKQQMPLGYLVHEVAKLMRRRFELEARSHGITLPQWRALSQIGANGSSTQRAIADALDADPMTVSGILDRLEKRGLIERAIDPSDSRAKLATLTPAGEKVFSSARAVGLAMYQRAIEGIEPDQRKAAIATLRTMHENLSGLTAELEEV